MHRGREILTQKKIACEKLRIKRAIVVVLKMKSVNLAIAFDMRYDCRWMDLGCYIGHIHILVLNWSIRFLFEPAPRSIGD